jgi:Tol biopolymer transport system component
MRTLRPRSLAAVAIACCTASGAVAAAPEEVCSLYTMRADGGDLRQVTHIEAFPVLSAPRWSHDGSRLVFEAGGSRPPRALIVDVSGRNLLDLGSGTSPDWSPDDKQVVYAVPASAGSSVWVINADGKVGNRLCEGTAPRWSPDGRQIALGSPLRVLDTHSGTLRKVFAAQDDAARTLGCDWSPDSRRLAVVVERDGKRSLLLVDLAESTKATARWQAVFDGAPAWSPEGKHLAVAIGEPPSQRRICLLEAEGDDPPHPIAGQRGDNRDPAWSPDGKSIVFVSTANSEVKP